MNIIEPKVELIKQSPGIEGILKQIEIAGRTCYKSEDKIAEGTAEEFVNKLIKMKHYSVLEHGTVYLEVPLDRSLEYDENADMTVKKYKRDPYSKVCVLDDVAYITTNYRVLIENYWMHDLSYICEPTDNHHLRTTFKVSTNIGVSREFNRHRSLSISERSTRYCNYNESGQVPYTLPTWIEGNDKDKVLNLNDDAYFAGCTHDLSWCYEDNWKPLDFYLHALLTSQYCYNNLIRLGWSPQQAREVLPLATNTEIVYTAFDKDWKKWIEQRLNSSTGEPHPNIKAVAALINNML